MFPQDLKNVMSIKSTPNDVPIQSPLLLTKLDQLDIEDTLSQQALNVGAIDKLRGFMKYSRKGDVYRVSKDRIQDWKEVSHRLPPSELKLQAARCMDCGVAFCQSGSGCPVSNIIPKVCFINPSGMNLFLTINGKMLLIDFS